MFTAQEQFTAAKANFEEQLAAANDLANKAIESVSQLINLNVNTAKASLEQSAVTTQQLLSVKDPQEFFALSAAQTQPNAEKALAYGREFAGIASAVQAEFADAVKAQFAEAARKVNTLVEDLAKYAPAGSEGAVALWKSAIANANTNYEQLSKNAKQVSEAVEDNLSKIAKQFSQATEKATSRAKK